MYAPVSSCSDALYDRQRRTPVSSERPGSLALAGQQPTELQAGEVRGRGRCPARLELASQRDPRALGEVWVDVADGGPLVVDQLDRAVHGVAEKHGARIARGEHQHRAAGRVSRGTAYVDTRDQRAVPVPGLQLVLDRRELARRSLVTRDEVRPVSGVATVGRVSEHRSAVDSRPA